MIKLNEIPLRNSDDCDRETLAAHAKQYYKALLKYGMKFGFDRTVVEDCIQTVFLDLWQHQERIRNNNSIKNYLLKSLRNHLFQYYRYQQRFAADDGLQTDDNYPDEWTVEAEIIEKEKLDQLTAEIKKQLGLLPQREREAIYLRYYENLSVGEIAEIMGVNKQSVSNNLQKALSKLRAKWEVGFSILLTFFQASF